VRNKDKYVLNAFLMVAVAAAVVHYFPTHAELKARLEEQFPVKAVDFMRQHSVPRPMLNSYGFGGYLVWSGEKVFVDGRSELFEDGGVLADYFQLTMLKPGGLDVLRRYQIQSCLLQRDEPLSVVLGALPDWQKVYADGLSAVYVRRKAVLAAESPIRGTSAGRGEPR